MMYCPPILRCLDCGGEEASTQFSVHMRGRGTLTPNREPTWVTVNLCPKSLELQGNRGGLPVSKLSSLTVSGAEESGVQMHIRIYIRYTY